jgi:hypothetical protein
VGGPGRYGDAARDRWVAQVLQDGFCVLPAHFAAERLRHWAEAFAPLLEAHMAREGDRRNRGPGRFYVTLPWREPFDDPAVFEDEDVLAVVERLVGADPVLCQLATDTPLRGSEYQDVHRDAPPLFPELATETPPFQLALNFPLCDVTAELGPFEIARGTHGLTKVEAMRQLESGATKLEPVLMKLGDVMIRDVRALHRGTPNQTDTPRPMVVLGYSRKCCSGRRSASACPARRCPACPRAPASCCVSIRWSIVSTRLSRRATSPSLTKGPSKGPLNPRGRAPLGKAHRRSRVLESAQAIMRARPVWLWRRQLGPGGAGRG